MRQHVFERTRHSVLCILRTECFSCGGSVAKLCPTLATPWNVACQAPLSMGFSRQEYWSGLPFPSPGDLPDPGIKPGSPALQTDSCIAGGFLLTELHRNAFLNSFFFLYVSLSPLAQPCPPILDISWWSILGLFSFVALDMILLVFLGSV